VLNFGGDGQASIPSTRWPMVRDLLIERFANENRQ
jgi:hypothetical protein